MLVCDNKLLLAGYLFSYFFTIPTSLFKLTMVRSSSAEAEENLKEIDLVIINLNSNGGTGTQLH